MCAETYLVAGRGCAFALPEPQPGFSQRISEHHLVPGEAWPVRIEASHALLMVVLEGALELMHNGAAAVLTARAMAHIEAGHAFGLVATGPQPVHLLVYWLDPGVSARFCTPETGRPEIGADNLLDATTWPPPRPETR
jgi:hypothetical protein